ncbi:MAG: NAD(P)/FAD-dependent oxidoreductase [Eubacteriales bacterium]|nr:NAD(P)/FAD-dependent oxidoreductase [Eubacteriales bacterium]
MPNNANNTKNANIAKELYDIVIIGAGITGCMTAYKLAGYNLRVAVAEAGDDVARGSTRANSAIVHAGYDPVPHTVKAEMNVKGCAQMPYICEKLKVKYRACGSLVAAFFEEETAALRTLYDRGTLNGVPGLELIDAARLRALEPNIADSAVAALWAPSAGIVCPYGLCIAAAEAAAAAGTEFFFDFSVNGIVKDDDVFHIAAEDGRVLRARCAVNAAGAHVREIALMAGEDNFPVRIIPRRGEYMLLDKSEGRTVSRPLFSVPTDKGKGILLTPTVDGNMIVGPNSHVVDSPDDTATTADGLAELTEGAARTVKNLNTRAVITSFSGIRSTPDSGDFYIKASDTVPGLLHLAGIESPGLASSPAIADRALELLFAMGLKAEARCGFTGERPPVIRMDELDDGAKQRLIEHNPAYGRIVCRCEGITEGEIVDAIRRLPGASSLDAVKRRTRAGMGRCQGGFCSSRVAAILSRELGIGMEDITKNGGASYILTGGQR